MEQITKNVFIENKVRGCNPGFVITSEGIVLIDVPIDLEYAKIWRKEILGRGKINFIINTEHHMDHFFSNSLFGGAIISSEGTRETMLTMDIEFIRKRTKILYIDPFPIPDNFELRLPNITYSERMTLYMGEHTFQIMHTPGHTLGQTSVYIPQEKVLFVGDNVFGQTRTAIHDADLAKWLESIELYESLDVKYVLGGHGKICDKAYLQTQRSIVRAWLNAKQKADSEAGIVDEITAREIDPFRDVRDTGIKPSVTLHSTSSSMSN